MLPSNADLNDYSSSRSNQRQSGVVYNNVFNPRDLFNRNQSPTDLHTHYSGDFGHVPVHDLTVKTDAKISITSLTNDADDTGSQHLDLRLTPTAQNTAMAATVLRPTLPTLQATPVPAPHHHHHQHRDTLTSATSLARYSITSTSVHPSLLPRIQSPSRDSPMLPPLADMHQILPPLETALASPSQHNRTHSNTPYSAHHISPKMTPSYGQVPIQYGPASATTTGPFRRFPVDPATWRTLSSESSNSTSSDPSRTQSSLSSCPSNARTSPTHSPAVDSIFQDQESDNGSNTDSDGQAEYDVQGIVSAAGYQCTFPGCVAPPFQTQYLLNSHTNVHSNQRPHFCPVEGCPRGLGGQGFKRKNEMIRHGLVHQSPGYVCPFCPDQQHKYPRPDNLQRHVRVHHVDRDKDDQALRDVLAQRPEGGSRGRRRRMA